MERKSRNNRQHCLANGGNNVCDKCCINPCGRQRKPNVCDLRKATQPLVPLRDTPLLRHVIVGAREAGITKFVIVTGYRSDLIIEWYAHNPVAGVKVEWVLNPDYHMANGVSVLKAKRAISGPFLLLMADHIFETATARRLLRQPLKKDEVILGVDSNIDRVFDLDDATKVKLNGDHIVQIGKDLSSYDALDTGMFLCTPALFHWLEAAQKDGNCSLSDGMKLMDQRNALRAFDIGDAIWQDVDTPEALANADWLFSCVEA